MGVGLEVDAEVGEDGAGVGGVEGVLRDVGEAGIVTHFHVEQVEHQAAAQADTTVEAAEVVAGERVAGGTTATKCSAFGICGRKAEVPLGHL